MKINFEISPEELADFLAIFASDTATCIHKHEEAVVQMLLDAKKIKASNENDDDGLIKKPEDLYRGITH